MMLYLQQQLNVVPPENSGFIFIPDTLREIECINHRESRDKRIINLLIRKEAFCKNNVDVHLGITLHDVIRVQTPYKCIDDDESDEASEREDESDEEFEEEQEGREDENDEDELPEPDW
jgi:hypothetical protein